MRIRNLLIIATALVAGLLVAPTAPAFAGAPSTFGSHVRACKQTMSFSGTHNPGMHSGAAGWDGHSC